MKAFFILWLCISPLCLSAQQIQITPLPSNTPGDDFAPAITNHGRVLYFTSEEGGLGQRLYTSLRSSTGWQEAVKLRGDANDATHAGTATLTPDGRTMYFAAYEHDVRSYGRTDIYLATVYKGRATEIENIGSAINSPAFESQPSISADGRTLYFVSDRAGGTGGTDIYVSVWNGTTWTPARQLEGANSTADEMCPVVSADGKTLYFSSNRSGGAGGFDLYVATIAGNTVQKIISMGSAINTPADELFYAAIPNSDQAFFTRSTQSGRYDNYSIVPNPFPGDPVTLVEGTVRDGNTGAPVSATITITDLSTGSRMADLRSDPESGDYFVTLPRGRLYSVTASAPGYVFHSDRYEVAPTSPGQTLQQNIVLAPLKGGVDRLLVFFDYDKTDLRSESFSELERVVELLRANAGIKVRFEGHTDDQGSDDYNNDLSKRRAQAVASYIISAGIDAFRVDAIGLGEGSPVVPNSSDENRARNRRVEMRITE